MSGKLQLVDYFGYFRESGSAWKIECWRLDRKPVALQNSQLFSKALADLQRLERRESRRGVINFLFNCPATHQIRLKKVHQGKVTYLINAGIHLQGEIPASEHCVKALNPDQQAIRICRFLNYLLEKDDDNQPLRSAKWHYAIAGYDASLFWLSAILSKYCGFWGIN